MKIAACYIRVSTEEQTELSPDSQLKELRRWAAQNSYTIPDRFIFQDEGISGKHTAKRTGFQQMIQAAKEKPKPFDAILLWKFSRFARNREDSIVYKSLLRKQLGIEVISISENIGDDKMSVLMEAIIEAMDEYYSINLAEEVRRGMKEAVCRGKRVSSAAFGYLIENGELVCDPLRAPIVQRIFHDTLSGMSERALAQQLNEEGVRTAKGGKLEPRTIRYLLKNPVYRGMIRWNEYAKHADRYKNSPDTLLIAGHHPPLISEELWQNTQALLRQREQQRVKYRRAPNGKVRGIFQGMLRCGSCGATMTYSPATKGYQCCRYARGSCGVSHFLSEARAIKAVETALLFHLKESSFPFEAPSSLSTPTDSSHEMLKRSIQRKLKQAKRAYLEGVDTLDEYQQTKTTLLAELKNIQKTVSVKETASFVSQTPPAPFRIEDFFSSPCPPAAKNALLQAIYEKIVYQKSTHTLLLYYHPFDLFSVLGPPN